MSLIYGVPEMAEEEVLEQIAFQAVYNICGWMTQNIKKLIHYLKYW